MQTKQFAIIAATISILSSYAPSVISSNEVDISVLTLASNNSSQHHPRIMFAGDLKKTGTSTESTNCEPGWVPLMGSTNDLSSSLRTIKGVGYGAPPKMFYPAPQRRLMAMRAAKVDAYRDLGEKLGGIRIQGNTTISDMVVHSDRLRVFIDTYIRNATVVALNPLEDSSYEAIVEITFVNPELASKEKMDQTAQCVPIEKLLEQKPKSTPPKKTKV